MFPIDDLIYLSPDGSEELDTISPEKVYVIGGFVDRSVNKVMVRLRCFPERERHARQRARDSVAAAAAEALLPRVHQSR